MKMKKKTVFQSYQNTPNKSFLFGKKSGYTEHHNWVVTTMASYSWDPGISAVLTEVFHGFPQPLQANDRIVSQNRLQSFLSNSLDINHPIIMHYIIWATNNTIT